MDDQGKRGIARDSLDDVVITEELARRPSRPPDYEAEAEALAGLARAMLDGPAALFQKLVEAVLAICGAGSAGVSIVEDGEGQATFRWAAVAGAWASHAGSSLPREAIPCGVVFARAVPLLFRDPARHFPALAPFTPPLVELLEVPFHGSEKTLGTVWVATHTAERPLDAEDQRVLARLSWFAEIAERMATDLREAEAGQSELARDMAARKAELERSNAALQNSAQQFRVVEGARLFVMFMSDATGHIASWNPAAEALFGWTAAEALGQPNAIIFAPEERAKGAPELELATAVRDGYAADERWHARKDGSLFWGSGEVTPIRAPGGEVQGFGKLLRDETPRKRAEDQLRESEARLRTALAAAEMGTWMWYVQADNQILDEPLRRLMGLGPDDRVVSLGDFLQFVHIEDRGRVQAEFERCVDGQGDLVTEFRTIWPDGSVHWIRDQGKTFADDAGRPLFLTGACVDVTERRRMEEVLRDADRRKDEFLAMLGHELRNPLAPLRGIAETLRRDGLDRASTERVCGMMERQVGHLSRLVDDLLDVSRITRGAIELRRESVNLLEIAEQAIEMAGGILEAREHELSLTLPRKPVFVEGDGTRLTQALFNLLNNAAKYTDRGGHIQLILAREKDQAVVRVLDDGSGMPPELVPKVFDLFTQGERTLDRAQGGLGLGLTLVKRLVELHNGSVEAHSAGRGQGSEFVVRLPLLPAHAEQRPPPAPAPAAPKATPRVDRVLVIDDNRDVAESLSWLLHGFAREIRTVHGGLEALEAAPAFGPDLILCDLGMPVMDGFETCRLLRRLPSLERTMIVAVSGYDGSRALTRSLEAGFDRHLVKPIGTAELEEIMAAAAAKQT